MTHKCKIAQQLQISCQMFQDWENIQELNPKEASNIIFDGFKKSRQNDEIESMSLYAEHMIEVGQYLKRKLADRAERAGRQPGNVTNSKFWYEVRKKIQEVLQQEKEMGIKRDIEIDDDDSDDILVSQNGAESEVRFVNKKMLLKLEFLSEFCHES